MWVDFIFANIFFSKNTYGLDIVLTRTVNILTTIALVKLTMLWTTGPWFHSYDKQDIKCVVYTLYIYDVFYKEDKLCHNLFASFTQIPFRKV